MKKSSGRRAEYIRAEINMLKTMIEVNRENERIRDRPLREKVEKEIKHRVLPGLSTKEKESLSVRELFEIILNYHQENPGSVRCPFYKWSHILKNSGVSARDFYEIVARNDGALGRWQSKTDEWENFDPLLANGRVKFLQGKLEILETKEDSTDMSGNLFEGMSVLPWEK